MKTVQPHLASVRIPFCLFLSLLLTSQPIMVAPAAAQAPNDAASQVSSPTRAWNSVKFPPHVASGQSGVPHTAGEDGSETQACVPSASRPDTRTGKLS